MAHPFASQAQASQKRRLSKLTGKAGKAWGSSSMYKKGSYPSTNAGTERAFTISGGTSKKNAGRKAQKLASGGIVKLQTGGALGGGGAPLGGGGGGLRGQGRRKGKHKQKNTTNIIIADRGQATGAGDSGARVLPVPVPRPVPVPVGGAAPVARPAVAAPAAPPVAAPAGPPGLPMGGPPMRPPMPGMADGGLTPGPSGYHSWGQGYKHGGVVKKADGGFLKDDSPDGYRGFPYSPTTDVDDAVSGKKDGGVVKKADGGAIKKAQFGGLGRVARRGNQATGFRPGAVPGVRPGAPGPGGTTSPVVPLTGGRPTRPGYGMKKGGKVHDDEAQDKKLIAKMISKEEKAEKKADGGTIKGSIYHQQGKGYNAGGSVKGGGANAYRRKRNNASAKAIPAKTEI